MSSIGVTPITPHYFITEFKQEGSFFLWLLRRKGIDSFEGVTKSMRRKSTLTGWNHQSKLSKAHSLLTQLKESFL